MSTTMEGSTTILSPGEAMALGEVLNAITQKRKIRWMDRSEVIRTGELRSLVRGENDYALAPWGTDVREMWVWITNGGFECTESLAHLVAMLPQGGLEIIAEELGHDPTPDEVAVHEQYKAATAKAKEDASCPE